MSPERLQRHAPCPCGSFRPLVACCLPWEEAFWRLVARLAGFSAMDPVRRLAARAAEVFWNVDVPEAAGRIGRDTCFTEWFLQDYVAPQRAGPLLGIFADTAAGLSAREDQWLFGLLLTPVRAFEVTEAPGPGGAGMKDLLTGSEGLLGPVGLPDGLIRSDMCVGRVLSVARLKRMGIGFTRFPPGSQAELSAYLRAAYGVSRPGRHVSLEDYADGAAHLYYHFSLERGRELGVRAHRTCPWRPFALRRMQYHGLDRARIRAALARQSTLEHAEDVEEGARYLWCHQTRGVALGTVLFQHDVIEASAETEDDLAKLVAFLEACLRGLVQRVPTDVLPDVPQTPPGIAWPASGAAGTMFVRRILASWPDTPCAALFDETPRAACRSQAGRSEVTQLLLALERDLARQKRLGKAWGDLGPVWEALRLTPPSSPLGGTCDSPVVRARERPRTGRQ